MDFDPSEFLAMAMTEEQDTVYTAPDLPQPHPEVHIPPSTFIVEGGLQMEQDMQIPVPTFGTLDFGGSHAPFENNVHAGLLNTCDLPVAIATDNLVEIAPTQSENTSTSKLLPVERTSSPHTVKKQIPVTYCESRFRKDFFGGVSERMKLFRLHCTICDQHLGCAPRITERQMRTHKLLTVAVCRKCFEYYGDINFPIEDGSEIYCCWCGEGGNVFCCSTCPKTVCKRCIKRNFGALKIKEIEENDNWSCFVCKPEDIWPHRALLWGLQRWSKEIRQNAALLPKEEMIAKLSKDTSHCCPKLNEVFPPISLPKKKVMSKVPLVLVAVFHQAEVRNQNDQPHVLPMIRYVSETRPPSPAINNKVLPGVNGSGYRPPMATPPCNPMYFKQLRHQSPCRPPPSLQPPHNTVHSTAVNRYAPYTLNRQMTTPRYPHQHRTTQSVLPYRSPPTPSQPQRPSEVIDLVNETPLRLALTKPQPNQNIVEHNIRWLENGVTNTKEALLPMKMVLDQFSVIKNELKQDFSKVTAYADRLSYNIKIAICNLAKINQDIIDSSKNALDNTVKTVVNDIQLNGMSTTAALAAKAILNNNNKPSTSITVSRTDTHKEVPEEQKESQELKQTTADLPSTGEEDMTAVLLCEAVLEVEGNKENESFNKKLKQNTVNNKYKPTPLSKKKGKPVCIARNSPRKSFSNKIKCPESKMEIIDLVDDDEEGEKKFDSSFYIQKYQIKPCKIVLKRCKASL